MRRAVLPVALWLVMGGVSACDAHETAAQDGNPHAAVVASLKRELVGIGQFDGVLITGVEPVAACATAFVTEKGRTVLDWSEIRNPAAHVEGALEVTPLQGMATGHVLAVPHEKQPSPVGDVARRMEASLGLLYMSCKKG